MPELPPSAEPTPRDEMHLTPMEAGRRLLLALLVLAVTAAAAPASTTPTATGYRAALLKAINAARAAQGLQPLTLEPHLVLAARRYSSVLARTSQLTHNALGQDVGERLSAAGYRGQAYGEDLAVGMSPAGTVAAWLASPMHRQVLLSPHFRRVGLGVAHGSWQGYAAHFVTADLGS
jgi:uncharacterized protein YkwD